MVDLKQIVADRLKELGKKPIPAAESVGLERGFINDILIGRKKSVGADKIELLAKALEMDSSQLTGGAPSGRPTSNVRAANVPFPYRDAMTRDIPVRGTAAGSMNGRGAFQITPDVIDYVARPPGIATARDIYALYVEGDSMEPRFFAGDLIYVHPHKPVRVNDVVVIQEQTSNNGEPQAFIKVFKKKSAKGILALQYNPPAEIDFIAPGTIMHKVLTNNELYGV